MEFSLSRFDTYIHMFHHVPHKHKYLHFINQQNKLQTLASTDLWTETLLVKCKSVERALSLESVASEFCMQIVIILNSL